MSTSCVQLPTHGSTRREFLELFYENSCFKPIVSFEISNSRERVRYENRFLVMYSLISPQTTECENNSYVH